MMHTLTFLITGFLGEDFFIVILDEDVVVKWVRPTYLFEVVNMEWVRIIDYFVLTCVEDRCVLAKYYTILRHLLYPFNQSFHPNLHITNASLYLFFQLNFGML